MVTYSLDMGQLTLTFVHQCLSAMRSNLMGNALAFSIKL